MKVAIYAIALNEVQFIERWYESIKNADYILLADTGSTDGTPELAESLGVNVFRISVKPWRFDVAKNAALNLLPDDIDVCVSLDIDEVLLPGWREALEAGWEPGTTVVNHRYRHNYNEWQWHNKIHARHGCHWKGVVHEEVFWAIPEKITAIPDIYLDEKQDVQKDRSVYLALLEKKIAEGDRNWRTFAFIAGEYEVTGNLPKTIEHRLNSYNNYEYKDSVSSFTARHLARTYFDMGDIENARKWNLQSVQDANEREAWFALEEFYYKTKEWQECLDAAIKCLQVNHRATGFTYNPAAWSFIVYDYAAIAAYNVGNLQLAVELGTKALEEFPDDPRLKTNLEFYKNG